MTETTQRTNADDARRFRALVPERTVLGLCREESDLRRLISLLRYSAFDIRKLSVVMFHPHPRPAARQRNESRALRTGLFMDGAVLHDGDEGSLLMAGPIKACLTIDVRRHSLLRGLLEALDRTLTAWCVDVPRLNRIEAGIAMGRCLVVLHAAIAEVPSALEAMRRASVEHVSMAYHDARLPSAIEVQPESRDGDDEI